jgi:hypothetical protein
MEVGLFGRLFIGVFCSAVALWLWKQGAAPTWWHKAFMLAVLAFTFFLLTRERLIMV